MEWRRRYFQSLSHCSCLSVEWLNLDRFETHKVHPLKSFDLNSQKPLRGDRKVEDFCNLKLALAFHEFHEH